MEATPIKYGDADDEVCPYCRRSGQSAEAELVEAIQGLIRIVEEMRISTGLYATQYKLLKKAKALVAASGAPRGEKQNDNANEER